MKKNWTMAGKYLLRTFIVGSLFATSCGGDFRVLATNIVQLASEQLDQQDDISFGDWISSELDDN
ncbi:MAG: hypothetical protein AABZ47_07750 [Planctomycetota bacterium]